jgi:hypothetical protein
MSPQKNGPGDGKDKPEMKVGDARISKTSEKEIAEAKKGEGSRVMSPEYTQAGKSLIPKSKEQQMVYRKTFEQMAPIDADTYLRKNEWGGGDVPAKVTLKFVNRLSEIVNEKGLTSPEQIEKAKDLLIEESGKEAPEYKITSDTWDLLNKKGNLSKIIHRVTREKNEDVGPVKYRQGSVGVSESTGEVMPEAPESKKVIENNPTKAFIYLKDSKGNITKEKK